MSFWKRSRWWRTRQTTSSMKSSCRTSGKTSRWDARFWAPSRRSGSWIATRVLDFFKQFYTPDDLIISAAGHLEHERVAELIRSKFGDVKTSRNGHVDVPAHTHSRISMRNKKELEQVHICLGVPSNPLSHEDRYVCYILNTILGGGMSSRLFQNIREKEGLVYTIFPA